METIRIGSKIIVPGRFEVTTSTTRFDVLNTACLLEAHIRELKQACDESKLRCDIHTKNLEKLDKDLVELRVQAQRQKVVTARLEKSLKETLAKNGVDIPGLADMLRAAHDFDGSFSAESLLEDIMLSFKHKRIVGSLSGMSTPSLSPTKTSASSRVLSDLDPSVLEDNDRRKRGLHESRSFRTRSKRTRVSSSSYDKSGGEGTNLKRVKAKARWNKLSGKKSGRA